MRPRCIQEISKLIQDNQRYPQDATRESQTSRGSQELDSRPLSLLSAAFGHFWRERERFQNVRIHSQSSGARTPARYPKTLLKHWTQSMIFPRYHKEIRDDTGHPQSSPKCVEHASKLFRNSIRVPQECSHELHPNFSDLFFSKEVPYFWLHSLSRKKIPRLTYRSRRGENLLGRRHRP